MFQVPSQFLSQFLPSSFPVPSQFLPSSFSYFPKLIRAKVHDGNSEGRLHWYKMSFLKSILKQNAVYQSNFQMSRQCLQRSDVFYLTLQRFTVSTYIGDGLQSEDFQTFFTKVCESRCVCYKAGLGFSWTRMMLSVIWGPFFNIQPKMKIFSHHYIFICPFFSEISPKNENVVMGKNLHFWLDI